MPNWIAPVVLLRLSNVVMTFAWYYHLKMKRWGILFAIVVSRGWRSSSAAYKCWRTGWGTSASAGGSARRK